MLGGGYALQTWLPTYFTTVRHLSALHISGYVITFEIGHFLGYVCGAYLVDLIGRRMSFILFALSTAFFVAMCMLLAVNDTILLLLILPLGFCRAGVYGGIAATLNELFPTRIRASGVGFCYNFGRAVGSIFPTMVGFVSATLPLGEAIGIFTAGAYGLVVTAAVLLPETKGKSLE
jgi:MFS family permease